MRAWEEFLRAQEAEIGSDTVEKWLRSLKIQRFDACNLYLEAKDSFQALWFEEHILGKAQATLFNGNQKRIKIHLSVANAPELKKGKGTLKKKSEVQKLPLFELSFDEPNPSCRFETFFVSEENRIAYQLLHEVAHPNSSDTASLGAFNPIYLYGGVGSGKSHLLMSLATALKNKGLNVLYVRAETFTDHVVSAIRAGEMSQFRQAYRNIDALLIDDVDVFSRKGATQEEFFHTFNTLHLQGKQILLTSQSHPQGLQLIEPRLISRFEWGIVLPLHAPKPEEFRFILENKSAAFDFSLSLPIKEFLLQHFQRNTKSLIKALETLVLRSHLDKGITNQILNPATLGHLLKDLIIEEEEAALTPTKIVRIVAEYYGIRVEDIFGKAQSRDCAQPRQISMYFCRVHLKLPFKKIGDLFGRDHSTVMTSVKQVQKGLDAQKTELYKDWYTISKKLYSPKG